MPEKLYVQFYESSPLIVGGDRLTQDRPCEYPFAIDTTVEGLRLVQAVAKFADLRGYERGLKAGQRASDLREAKQARRDVCPVCGEIIDPENTSVVHRKAADGDRVVTYHIECDPVQEIDFCKPVDTYVDLLSGEACKNPVLVVPAVDSPEPEVLP